MGASRPKQQLHMVWAAERIDSPPAVEVPPGYSMRTYQPGDAAGLIELMRLAGFTKWDGASLAEALVRALPEGIFLIVDDAGGALVAVTMATHNPLDVHPSGGELGWVAGHPDHRGRGLGRAVCAAVTRRFLEAGYRRIYLRTDDWRLPAIKIYLKLGYVPFLHAPDMAERWRALCETLRWPFTPDRWPRAEPGRPAPAAPGERPDDDRPAGRLLARVDRVGGFSTMAKLFEVKSVDREFYESRLRDFLPNTIIDVHTHIWREPRPPKPHDPAARTVSWPWRVARANPVEDLLQTYRLMLPDQSVTPVVFPSLTASEDLDSANGYVAESAARHDLPSLIFAGPSWSAAELEEKILAGGFLGAKVYLTFAPDYLPAGEIRIFDFLPPHQLEVLDRHGWVVMLHIPRSARLGDPVNLAQLLEIEQRFGNAGVIVAHVGRAYCIENVGDAFGALAPTQRLCFDISANTNEEVFRRLIDAVGPERILFGSDLPILRMRTRRICEGGRYVNLVPKGLYGDVSDDPHMREVDDEEAKRLSFFLYEEIDAFRRAAQAEGLTPADIENVFHNNAQRLLNAAASGAGD